MSLMLLANLCGCALNQEIPDVRVYRELPFGDEPEAIEVWTLKDDYRIVGASEWEEMRPFMLMVPPETWSEIKKGWMRACLMAGQSASINRNACEHQVESVDGFVRDLDNIIKTIMRK